MDTQTEIGTFDPDDAVTSFLLPKKKVNIGSSKSGSVPSEQVIDNIITEVQVQDWMKNKPVHHQKVDSAFCLVLQKFHRSKRALVNEADVRYFGRFAHSAPHLTYKVETYFLDLLEYMGSLENINILPEKSTSSSKLASSCKADFVLVKRAIPFLPIEVKATFKSQKPVKEHVAQLLKQVLTSKNLLTLRYTMPPMFEHRRIAVVGILTDLNHAHCYLMCPAKLKGQISFNIPNLVNDGTPQVDYTTLFGLDAPTKKLCLLEHIALEHCVFDLSLKSSINGIAQIISAASELCAMPSSQCHLIVSMSLEVFPKCTATILSLKNTQVHHAYYGAYSVCYKCSYHEKVFFAMKRFHIKAGNSGDPNVAATEQKLWKHVYGCDVKIVQRYMKKGAKSEDLALIMPWVDPVSNDRQSDSGFISKVKKLCAEVKELQQNTRALVHGDIRWPNIGQVVFDDGTLYPVLLDLSSLLSEKTELDFTDIEPKGHTAVYSGEILSKVKEYFAQLTPLPTRDELGY